MHGHYEPTRDMISSTPAKHHRIFLLSLILFIGSVVIFAVSVILPSCRQKTYPVLNDGELPAELTESNLPMYVSYLYLNQKTPHKGLALMGGIGGVIHSDSAEHATCGFRLIFVTDGVENRPTELAYISSEGGAIQKAELSWAPFTEHGIHTARADINFLPNAVLNGNELFISVDGEQWYPYLMIESGLAIYFVRVSALPMEVETGYPISQVEKIYRKSCKNR